MKKIILIVQRQIRISPGVLNLKVNQARIPALSKETSNARILIHNALIQVLRKKISGVRVLVHNRETRMVKGHPLRKGNPIRISRIPMIGKIRMMIPLAEKQEQADLIKEIYKGAYHKLSRRTGKFVSKL